MPSMSGFSGNSCIKTVLTDLDLSSRVSVPTSNRPIDCGGMEYFARMEETVDRARE